MTPAAVKRSDEGKIWPWIAATLAGLLSALTIAAYSSARADIKAFDNALRVIGERTGVLEQRDRDTDRRLERMEKKLDQLLERK